MDWETPSPDWRSRRKRSSTSVTVWTDLHSIFDILQRTVDSCPELVARFFGKVLELRPGEPVWDVSHWQGFIRRALVVGRVGTHVWERYRR